LVEGLPRHWAYCHAALAIWDGEALEGLAVQHSKLAREVGALGVLSLAVGTLVGAVAHAGELVRANSLAEEAVAMNPLQAPYSLLMVAAWRGQSAEVERIVDDNLERAVESGEGMAVAFIQWAKASLYNSLGSHEQALAAISESLEYPEELWANGVLEQTVEAAARSGATEVATRALADLSEKATAAGTPWALGVLERSRALLATGGAAEEHYRASIDSLAPTHIRLDLARTHLAYGEWLRREARRADARAQLRIAHDMFTAFGSEAYGARAARELAATGEHVRKREANAADSLTPQELQVARLARQGFTNRQIGDQLFISHKTVAYHLHKVFSKLDVTSRTQLHVALDGSGPPSA
jgi:DNA-binding CsgD family transcriptional regulator